ncbi:MAG: hypothetical protein ACRDJN_02380 [Chloroflexota bacterium]
MLPPSRPRVILPSYRMLRLELVETAERDDGQYLQLTLLGRACGRSGLTFESAMRLVELLRRLRPEDLTPERLMASLQILPESDGGYTPVMRRGRAESVRPQQAAARYGGDVVRMLQAGAQDEFDYFARCKRAAILWDWITGVPVEEIEQRFTTTPFQGRIGRGDILRFADATRFHLRSAHQIANALYVGAGPSEQSVETLLRQLETGLPRDAVGLLELPVRLDRGAYLALYGAGLRTVQDVAEASPTVVKDLLGANASAVRPELATPKAG